jgi:membrane-associated phospholipid phosphatase
MNKNSKTVQASLLWIWCPPLIFLLLTGIIILLGKNQDIFIYVNSISRFTGDKFWAVLTIFADGLVAFVIIFPFIYRKPRLIWAVLIAAALFAIFGQAIKNLAQVPRPPQILSPEDFHLIGQGWRHNSFPSGHSSMIFNLAGALIMTTPKKWLRFFLIGAASLIAASRMVVGVHWPADVLAGAAFGWTAIWVGLKLSNLSRWAWTGWGQKILGMLLLLACVVLFFTDYTGHSDIMDIQRLIAVIFFMWGGYQYLRVWGWKNQS